MAFILTILKNLFHEILFLENLVPRKFRSIQYTHTHTHTHSLYVFLIVPAQVVNIKYEVSTDSITIWWNNTQVC